MFRRKKGVSRQQDQQLRGSCSSKNLLQINLKWLVLSEQGAGRVESKERKADPVQGRAFPLV